MFFVKSEVFILCEMKLVANDECADQKADGNAKLQDDQSIAKMGFARYDVSFERCNRPE